jgi:pimeloyl-ACP methyl ester carboxylesterase
MNTKYLLQQILLLITVSISTPCYSQPGKILNPILCQSDPTQSYALYIPAKGNKTPLPVIYFFDPHADGGLPLSKYQSLADEYGFILVGSNNSKNGNDYPTAENIWRHLLEDTRARLKVSSDRIYTGGFSGGAKVAGYIALRHPEVKGVIANGAGLPDGTPAGDFNFSFTAVAGEGDMNMTDLVAFSNELDNSRTRHRIILFDGKHEWAPENTMRIAFAGLQFDAMEKKLIPKDDAQIDRYIAKSKNRLAADRLSNQLIKAAQECKIAVSFLNGLTTKTAWFQSAADSLSHNRLYQQQQQARLDLLTKEQNTKAEYAQFFQQDNTAYWHRTIAGLYAAVGGPKDEIAMNHRLLAYLSLAFYSFSNRLINANENTGARHFVELYKIADPTNSEAWYLSAILDARDANARAAENDLHKAVRNGFKDERRMQQQPEFKNPSLKITLPGIGRKTRASTK